MQVVITVLSTDLVNPPDMLGLVGATAALQISDIPFRGTMSGMRVGRSPEGQWLFNPTYAEQDASEINMVVSGNKDAITMVEAGAKEVPESEILEGLEFGHDAVKNIIREIEEFDAEVRREGQRKPKAEIMEEVESFLEPRYRDLTSALIDACKNGDSETVEDFSRKIDRVAVEAGEAFPNEYRKVVLVKSMVLRETATRDALAGEIEPQISEHLKKSIMDASEGGLTKREASTIRKDARKALSEPFRNTFAGLEKHVKGITGDLEKKLLRRMILDEDRRPDGRKSFQIRKLTCEVGVLPMTHGTGLFTRGETQVLSIATLGAYGEKQLLDDLGTEEYKSFMHHYNFPPFSSGEARMLRGPKRREIGHGALVERAISPLIPDAEEFPYTVRLVSEVLESNGSTSMGSLCASSMALMDAGVPLKDGAALSGIAMGLVIEEGRYAVLSDIQGLEDAIGDMDFKIAGSRRGVTALQMDIKCLGISREILKAALEQASEGRAFITKAMSQAIDEPRKELSPNAPKMLQISIPVKKIGEVIGPGGKVIRGLIEKYGVDIDVEDDGKIFVFGRDGDNVENTRRAIESLTREPEVGEKFDGKVVKTTNFGAFVQLVPGKDGLVHISKLSRKRVDRVEDVVKVGDEIQVEIEEIDNLGRINLKPVGTPPGDRED